MRRSAAAVERPWSLFELAVATMLLTYVWRVQQLFPALAAAQLTSLSTLGALVLVFVARSPSQAFPSLRHPVFRWTALILFWMALGIPTGIFPGLTFRFIYQDHLKTFFLMLLIVAAVRSLRDVERFMMVHLVGATLYSAVLVMRVAPGADGRLPGAIYYDANDVAMVLVCTLPFAVYLLRPGTAVTLKLFAAFAFALTAFTIVRTGSRGGFLALLGVLGYLLFAFRTIPTSRRVGALVAMLLALVLFGGDQYWGRMQTLLKPSEDYNWAGNGGTGRVEIWKRGMGYMAQRPILGVGASAFYVAEGTLSEISRIQARGRGFKWSAPHNSFVQIGAELGVFGLVAFVALLWNAHSLARRGLGALDLRARAVGQVLSASVLGFAIAGFFLSQAYSAYLYSLLGLIIALSRLPRPATPRAA